MREKRGTIVRRGSEEEKSGKRQRRELRWGEQIPSGLFVAMMDERRQEQRFRGGGRDDEG